MFINLKPLAQRPDAIGGQAVIARLRPQLARVTGISLFLGTVQDLRGGGRSSNSTYQYTLKSDNIADLRKWAARLADQMKSQDALTDVDTDQQENGVETMVTVDKDTASRLGITSRDVDNALYNGFGQRQVATIYSDINQYKVIMEVAPRFRQSPEALNDIYVPARAAGVGVANVSSLVNPASRDQSTGQALSAGSTMVPLSAIARFSESAKASSVNHQDGELATTVSYNLAEGSTLQQGQAAVKQAEAEIGLPNKYAAALKAQQGPRKSLKASSRCSSLRHSSSSTSCWAFCMKAWYTLSRCCLPCHQRV